MSRIPRPYRGVSWDPFYKRWIATMTVNGKRLWLGAFAAPEDAARAYDAAALQHHGARAKLNGLKAA